MNHHTAEGLKVWNLMYCPLLTGVDVVRRVQAIPCSSLKKLERHALDLLKKNIDQFDEVYQKDIIEGAEKGDLEKAMTAFRAAHIRNSKKITFSLFWDDRPEVVL